MTAVLPRRTFTATIVAVGPPDRTREAREVLQALAARTAVRNILITLGDDPEPEIVTDGDVVTIEGLVPRYLNNAVARLRVSSMPSLAWWRGGEREQLESLAGLVDRVVEPEAIGDLLVGRRGRVAGVLERPAQRDQHAPLGLRELRPHVLLRALRRRQHRLRVARAEAERAGPVVEREHADPGAAERAHRGEPVHPADVHDDRRVHDESSSSTDELASQFAVSA